MKKRRPQLIRATKGGVPVPSQDGRLLVARDIVEVEWSPWWARREAAGEIEKVEQSQSHAQPQKQPAKGGKLHGDMT